MEEREEKIVLANKVAELYRLPVFQEVVLTKFIDEGIQKYCLQDNVGSEGVQDQLKARKILYDFFYGIVQEAEVLKTESKGE